MKYPVVVHHDSGTTYGVTVPDIPGCFSAGETFDEALANTVEAINNHLQILAEDGAPIAKANQIENYKDDADYAGGIWGFVDVDVSPYLGQTEKLNVTLPTFLVRKIDSLYKNRSKFLTEAALKALG